jgi:isoquinoline 1-oxidoreductase subunit alpha
MAGFIGRSFRLLVERCGQETFRFDCCDSIAWAIGRWRQYDRDYSIKTKARGCGMAKLNVNGKTLEVDVEPTTPLLWVLREQLGLTGSKFGCGIAQCGACTVHLDGTPLRSCALPVSAVGETQKIVTIEGLSSDGSHPIQKAWLAMDVPQCGYCQSGMIMAAAALLAKTPKPTDSDINVAITNICRCGTYQRVRAAIHSAAGQSV